MHDLSTERRTRHLLRSSILVIAIFALDKVTGFIKLLLMTNRFGTSPDADAYATAHQLPELFQAMLVGGALAAALIPVYSAYLTAADHKSATKLANTVLTVTSSILALICTIAICFAPWLTQTLLVPDFSPEQQAVTASLMRIILLSSTFLGIGSVYTSLLNARQHFVMPAIGTVILEVGQIIGLYYFVPHWGIYGVAWGGVLGAVLYIIVQIPALIHHRIGYRPQFAWRLAGVQELAHLMWPRVVTLSAYQAVDLIFIRLASPLPEGSISAYFYALLAMVFMPKTLFSIAISTVVFPTLSEQYNRGDLTNLKHMVSRALLAVWALVIPAAIGLITLGKPAVIFLFQRGSFDADASTLVYSLIIILGWRLIAEATQEVLFLPFYARHNTQLPMWLTLIWMIINISLSYIFVGPFGIQGLAWATALSALALTIALYSLNRWQLDMLEQTMLTPAFRRILASCVGMVAVILCIDRLGFSTLPFLILAIIGGGASYLLLYIGLGGKELLPIWRLLRHR